MNRFVFGVLLTLGIGALILFLLGVAIKGAVIVS